MALKSLSLQVKQNNKDDVWDVMWHSVSNETWDDIWNGSTLNSFVWNTIREQMSKHIGDELLFQAETD